MIHDNRPYEVRRAEHIAKHASKLTNVERTLIASLTEAVKAKLRGANLKYALDIITEGVVNANDTLFDEKAQERDQWADIAIASMGTLLVSAGRVDLQGVNNKRVQAVFASVHVKG